MRAARAAPGMTVLVMTALAAPAASAAGAESGLPEPLTATPGDPVRGRAIVVDRTQGLCLLCHSGPFDGNAQERAQGNLAGNLGGAGSRWTAAQLRLRIVDARRADPGGLMPSFHTADGRQRVGAAWAGRPILDAQQVEDVVAFLQTLK